MKSNANKVNWFQSVCPGQPDYDEWIDWLKQYYPVVPHMILTNRRILLLVGSEAYLKEVWSMKNDYYNGVCHLEWKLEEKEQNE